ncbi:NHL repeat-containing protein [Brevundimonas vitis]|uniref:transcriptional regulator n=1 Tax=Brevundimonas vitisensis TaxID=2800818 RepID=UPI001E486E9C|nr:transcriptional regulator [Brevundimonas vitisensis]
MIDNGYLLGLYGGTSTFTSSSAGSALSAATRRQPTPPWDASAQAQAPKADALVRAALGGRRFIDEGAARVDLNAASADYKKLFALYQGLEALNAVSNRAATKGVGAAEQALLAKRFAAGLAEVGTYVASARLEDVRVVQGISSSTSKTTAAVQRDSAISITGPIHEGSADSEVAAFAGEVRFDITIKRGTLGKTTVPIDLDDMGTTPRTLGTVTSFINEKLDAAGLDTRIGREQLKSEPKTLTVAGKTVTLPNGPDRWALAIRGVSTETVSFTASQSADAVYVAQATGTGAEQLLKFQTDQGGTPPDAVARLGESHWVEGRASQTALPEGVETIRASATGPDGTLWLVADMKAGTGDQPIKGQQDVALLKLDSTGRVVATRALGAASSASGHAIAVDADGRVAVAGSVTGALIPGQSVVDPALSDSFVTVFDAAGEELWTQSRGARAADEATSVSFGADGLVYVGGRAKSAMTGASSAGGWDGYVQAFKASQPYPGAAYTVTSVGVDQFGSGSDDDVQATAIDGSNLYTAGVEAGRLVVRHFTLDAAGKPSLASSRDLGVAGGDIAGLAVSDGKVILTGTTRNDALDIGTINTAHSGGTDAFIAVLGSDLTASADDRLTYVGTAGDDTAADIKLHDGKVWITGTENRALDAKATDPTTAYLSRVDPLTGVVEWNRQWAGAGDKAAPLTLAIASGGASVLDRLGLPTGEIDQTASKRLIDATALRPGDRFYVSPANGGRQVAVTIEARDTLQTLARKIEQASNTRLKVTVAAESADKAEGTRGQNALQAGLHRLTITARDGKVGAVISAGEPGRDALAGLGLSAGFIGATGGTGEIKTFGLDLPKTLSLSTPEAQKATGERLQAAMKAVRDAYRSLSPTANTPAVTGQAPAYLTAQLANYQAALARLGG